jgi:Domain of unknown function (DUF4913)
LDESTRRLDVDEDRAFIDQLRIDLAATAAATATAPTAGGATKPDAREYDTWQAWVDGWLTTRISRHPHRARWCHRYVEHPEVAERLEALWHAWQAQWPQPLARLSWWRDGLDPQLAVITAEDGPLRECSAFEREHVCAPVLADPSDVRGSRLVRHSTPGGSAARGSQDTHD